jgi:hypothetical protein
MAQGYRPGDCHKAIAAVNPAAGTSYGIVALGGRVDLVAVFRDEKIILTGIDAKALGELPAAQAVQRTGRRPARR